MAPRAPRCSDCDDQPVVRCRRCSATACAAHAFPAGERCAACERDWQDEALTRRSAKLIFAPPLAVLVGGFVFGVLLPRLVNHDGNVPLPARLGISVPTQNTRMPARASIRHLRPRSMIHLD